MKRFVWPAMTALAVTLATGTALWAVGGPTSLLVKFPLPRRAVLVKPTVLVDENGNILFNDTTPGKVELASPLTLDGIVATQAAIPGTAVQSLNFVSDGFPNTRLITNFVPASTRYAITSLTFANSGTLPLNYSVTANQPASPTNCEDFSSGVPFLSVSVPAGQTQHLTFPQPFVASAPIPGGGVWCLLATYNGSPPGAGASMSITMVGYAL